ncbi:MAG: hypothetical protein GY754_09880 [bacterium]|nr:hypothetical protein [bacterium]
MYDLLEDVSKTTIRLLLKEPFYGHFFTSIVKEVSSEVSTLGVILMPNEMVKLHINEDFWKNQLPDENLKYGAIKHEILHIVFKHILRARDFSHRSIFNIAADLVVNQYIDRDQLLKGAIGFEHFPELNLTFNQSADYYYKKLMALYEDPENKKGWESWKNLKEILDDEEAFEDHSGWAEDNRSKAEARVVDSIIDNAIGNALKRVRSKEYGGLPAGLVLYLDQFLESLTPRVNWKRVLRLFAAGSSRTYLKNSLKKPSKRYGTNPGLKIKKRNKLLVAIDTSESISQEELNRFFNELYYIYKQGSEIFVVECDTKITGSYPYRGITPGQVTGRGGTCFDEPVRFANEKYNPDAIIYFTDGFAPPLRVSSRNPILWVVSPEGTDEEGEYWERLEGRKVKMDF